MRIVLQKRKLAQVSRLNMRRNKSKRVNSNKRFELMVQALLDLSLKEIPVEKLSIVKERLETEVHSFKDQYKFERRTMTSSKTEREL